MIEMPSVNGGGDIDFEDIADAIFDYIWFQDNIPKHFFNHKESWEFGISCSASNYWFTTEESVVCMFVFAQKMVNKRIIENIPSLDDDISWTTINNNDCKYNSDDGYLDMFWGINLVEAFIHDSFSDLNSF